MTGPSADVVAAAIVAACRQTGEDPEMLARGTLMLRARHYALHALARAYPETSPAAVAHMLGCGRNSGQFAANSRTQIADPNADPPRRKAHWWSDEAFHRVWKAVERAAGRPEDSGAALQKPPPYRPPEGTVKKMLDGGQAPRDLGRLEPGGGSREAASIIQMGKSGYRPPEGAAKAAIADEADDGPVFDARGRRFSDHDAFRRRPQHVDSKITLQEMLAQAARNTAAMQTPKED